MSDLLELALTAFTSFRTPSKITAALRVGGLANLENELAVLDPEVRERIYSKAEEMRCQGVGVIIFGGEDYPRKLIENQRPVAPIIFYRGNKDLLYVNGIGMCGSRHVSDRGLETATRCGVLASEKGMTVVSGYAAGVDTATHLASLRSGGTTVIVLPEGIDHFRIKRKFSKDFDWDRTVVVSQFSPSQPWRAHGAMARNRIIFGLPNVLLVIEAGEKGGTLAAGTGALQRGRPVMAVDFGDATPIGNRLLIEQGARPIRTPQQLRKSLDDVSNGETDDGVLKLF